MICKSNSNHRRGKDERTINGSSSSIRNFIIQQLRRPLRVLPQQGIQELREVVTFTTSKRLENEVKMVDPIPGNNQTQPLDPWNPQSCINPKNKY